MSKATVIPFGPQHPVLPEPLHLDLVVQDETVVDVLPQIGFVHRGLEKLVETRDYNQFIYIAERICGICAMGHSLGYAETVESLMGVEVPKRAEYLRVIWHELSRIHSHLLWLGLAADAFGFESMFMHCWRLRERVLDLFEKTTGGRVILSVVKVGGVVRDIDASQMAEIVSVLDGIKGEYTQIMNTLLTDTSVKNRTVGVGHITTEDAAALSMVGPFARASNLPYDVRSFGRGAYGDLADFAPITATEGDCYARVKVRCLEVLQSIEIIKELGAKIPAGDIEVAVKGAPADGAQAQAHAHLAEPRRYDRGPERVRLGRRQHDHPDHRPLHQLHGKVGGYGKLQTGRHDLRLSVQEARDRAVPLRAETGPGGAQRAYRKRCECVHSVRHLRQELPGRRHRGGEEGAHLGHRSVPLRAVRYLRARLPQALPDHGSRLHAHRHREILPRGACPRPEGGGDGIVSLTAR